ncbi:MAG: DsrE family protein [Oscillospiraceae bacterium]|nr:DsrE family protein [Oscillospiraceae bacterium]
MSKEKTLHILWTTDNADTARFMVLFYAANSMTNRLWDHVTVILWGAAVKLAVENEAVQEEIKIAQHAGVKLSACGSCARRYGVAEDLEDLGIEVGAWVGPFTEMVKSGEPIIYV